MVRPLSRRSTIGFVNLLHLTIPEYMRAFCILTEVVLIGTSLGRIRKLTVTQRFSATALYLWVLGAAVGQVRTFTNPAYISLYISMFAAIFAWIYLGRVYYVHGGVPSSNGAATDSGRTGRRRV